MNIGLIGYGQVGKEVEKAALSRGHRISFIVDENNRHEMVPSMLALAEVVIEFTGPEAAFGNIKACLEAGVPVVSGTTGWLDRLDEASSLCQKVNGSFFYATNFSIGVNLFFELNSCLARMMNSHPEYSVRTEEIHHIRKKDSPSGTAITLAGQLIRHLDQYSGWAQELIPGPDKVPVTSIREGNVTGTHSVIYVSDEDKITITHEAFSRRSFATGAVSAAEFLAGRKGVFTMKDLLSDNKPD